MHMHMQTIRQDVDKNTATTVNNLHKKDVEDGQPTQWAEAMPNGCVTNAEQGTNKTMTKQDIFKPIPMYTPDGGTEPELDNLIRVHPSGGGGGVGRARAVLIRFQQLLLIFFLGLFVFWVVRCIAYSCITIVLWWCDSCIIVVS